MIADKPSSVETWSTDAYKRDITPEHLVPKDKKRLEIYYKHLPEVYYTKGDKPRSTTDNLYHSMNYRTDSKDVFHLRGFCSGSGIVSQTAESLASSVLFPVDYRCGWDLGLVEHQRKLGRSLTQLQPQVVLFTADFQNWNVGWSRRGIEDLKVARE